MFPLLFNVIGLALSAVGTIAQVGAASQQAAASARAEKLRKQQLTLESMRQRREIVRNSLRARAAALAASTAQGGTGGSGIEGGLGQIQAKAADNTVGVNQGEAIGRGIFDANASYASWGALASFGGGLSSLGGTINDNSDTLSRIFGK